MVRLQALKYAHLRESPLEVTVSQLSENGGWWGVYGQKVPLVLEIGLGKDPHLIERALQSPDRLHIGLEYSRKKLDKVLAKAIRAGVENIRLLLADAVRILPTLFEDGSIHQVYSFFPDPWPKARHHKKRLVQPAFIRELVGKMAPGARIELRTDDREYFEQMLEVMEGESGLVNRHGAGTFLLDPEDPDDHIPTLFEARFRAVGKPIHYLYYEKPRSTEA